MSCALQVPSQVVISSNVNGNMKRFFFLNCFFFIIPGEMDETFSAGSMMAPLERFLGCISMRRSLQRIIQDSQDCPSALPITEPGVIAFR